MTGVTVFVFLSIVFNLFVGYNQQLSQSLILRLLTPTIVLVLFLIIETIFYKRNRFWARPSAWIRVHIVCLYTALVMLTIIRIIVIILLPMYVSPVSFSNFFHNFSIAAFFVYWGGLIIGHIFFIGVMIKTRSARKTVPQDAGNPTNLLDNILE